MPSTLEREIAEQPEAIARFLDLERPSVERIAQHIRARRPRFVLIAARGSSDNAARYAQYALGIACGLPVALAAPSLVTLYLSPPDLRGALVIGISQSGRSPDIVETVDAARRGGARTLAIVNDSNSPLANAAADVVPLHAGEEKSVAATKTYTTELAAVLLLAAVLGRRPDLSRGLERIPAVLEETLRIAPAAARAARAFAGALRTVVLARGINFPTAHEIALKLKELALLHAEPYSTADFAHGPIALADAKLPAILVAPPGSAADVELRALRVRLQKRGSRVLAIGPPGRASLPLAEVPELLSPILAVVPGQLLALYAARVRGLDPERPRGLSKVTKTR